MPTRYAASQQPNRQVSSTACDVPVTNEARIDRAWADNGTLEPVGNRDQQGNVDNPWIKIASDIVEVSVAAFVESFSTLKSEEKAGPRVVEVPPYKHLTAWNAVPPQEQKEATELETPISFKDMVVKWVNKYGNRGYFVMASDDRGVCEMAKTRTIMPGAAPTELTMALLGVREDGTTGGLDYYVVSAPVSGETYTQEYAVDPIEAYTYIKPTWATDAGTLQASLQRWSATSVSNA
jgi:hypothetical protein